MNFALSPAQPSPAHVVLCQWTALAKQISWLLIDCSCLPAVARHGLRPRHADDSGHSLCHSECPSPSRPTDNGGVPPAQSVPSQPGPAKIGFSDLPLLLGTPVLLRCRMVFRGIVEAVVTDTDLPAQKMSVCELVRQGSWLCEPRLCKRSCT